MRGTTRRFSFFISLSGSSLLRAEKEQKANLRSFHWAALRPRDSTWPQLWAARIYCTVHGNSAGGHL